MVVVVKSIAFDCEALTEDGNESAYLTDQIRSNPDTEEMEVIIPV